MKNGKRVTDYLDECAACLAMQRSNDLATLEALNQRITDDRAGQLYQACLADSWTPAELDDAYARRFGAA